MCYSITSVLSATPLRLMTLITHEPIRIRELSPTGLFLRVKDRVNHRNDITMESVMVAHEE